MPRANQFQTLNETEMVFGRKFAKAAMATIGIAVEDSPTPGQLVNSKSGATYRPIPCPTVNGRVTFYLTPDGVPFFTSPSPFDWLLLIDSTTSEVLMVPWPALWTQIVLSFNKPHAGLWCEKTSGYISVGIHVEWAQSVGLVKRTIEGKIGKHKFGNARAVEMAVDDQFVHLHAHSMYCLSGDSVVYNCRRHHNRGKCYREDYTNLAKSQTIRDIYTNWHKVRSHHRQKYQYQVKVFDGERFVAAKIKNVVSSGRKEVYWLKTESGKSVKATAQHKFLTSDGWRRVEELSTGDLMACNGHALYEDGDWLYQKYALEGLHQQQIADICKCDRHTISDRLHKLGIAKTKGEWMKGHLVRPETTAKIVAKRLSHRGELPEPTSRSGQHLRARWHRKPECEACGSKSQLQVHHIDRDTSNNDETNLRTLCIKCHKVEHLVWLTTARYERLSSVELVGTEDTYDIEVDHPAHNFVANGFVTHNSLLDGASTIEGMVEKAALNGQRACALTDHGHMFGCWKFYQTAKAWGIKPLLGCEVYLVDDINTKYQRVQPDGTMRDARFEHHTTVLAMNQTGWANLCKLLTAAYRDHFFYVPRIDHKMLLEHSDGLFILSGCFKGPVSWYLSKYEQPADAPPIPPWWRYDPDKAYATAKMYKDKLGDRFGIEVQSNNYAKHMEAMPRVAQLADDLGIKKYVTNDSHAETEEDGAFQSLLSKINGKDDDLSAEKKKFCYYMKARSEIDPVGILQPADFTNTCEIADRCNLEFPKGFLFPRYSVEQDEHWARYTEARGDPR
jgi:hypothetical protein